MILDTQYPQLIKVLEEKKSFVICLPATASTDAQAAACGLYLALSKAGKQVSLSCVGLTNKESDLIAIEKITSELQTQGGNILTISLPYQEGALDAVTYDVEGDKFRVVIKPKEGFPKINTENVEFGYSGGKIDAVVTIEASSLETLGNIYASNQALFGGIEIINIDRRFNNAQFGTINVVEKQASTISEIVYAMISYLKIEVDKDIATNLISGMVHATNNFSAPTTNADTFDIVSRLMRAGGVKKPLSNSPSTSVLSQPVATTFPKPSVVQNIPTQTPEPKLAPVNLDPANQNGAAPVANQTPSDWLKPKIFKGSSNLV